MYLGIDACPATQRKTRVKQMLHSLYVSKGNCFDFVLQVLRALMGQGEGKEAQHAPAALITAPLTLPRDPSTAVDLSTCNYQVLHLQSAFPDLLLAQERPCSSL